MLLVANRKVLLLILAALWDGLQTELRMASLHLMGLSTLCLSTNPQTVSTVSILCVHSLHSCCALSVRLKLQIVGHGVKQILLDLPVHLFCQKKNGFVIKMLDHEVFIFKAMHLIGVIL